MRQDNVLHFQLFNCRINNIKNQTRLNHNYRYFMDFNVVLWKNRLRAVSARPYKAPCKSRFSEKKGSLNALVPGALIHSGC